jgi:small subunit ribosomal protein S4
MARYTGPVCKLCRREGLKLYLKGEKCLSDKCTVTKRAQVPGQHGARRKKLTEYGLQLREKQKARRYYGVLERQFEAYFEIANSKQGVTGDNLLQLLETRFDNIVYRLGFALSRAEAKQLIIHGHFKVNGKKITIPSYLLKDGDSIEIKDKSKDSPKIKSNLEINDILVLGGRDQVRQLRRELGALSGHPHGGDEIDEATGARADLFVIITTCAANARHS